MNKMEYVAALRELADFVEKKPFPEQWKERSWGDDNTYPAPSLFFYVNNKKDFGVIASAMGTFEKDITESYTKAITKLSSGVTIILNGQREGVCKKVIVGTRTIAAEPERVEVIEAVPEHEEEIVEWECPESFIALKDEE